MALTDDDSPRGRLALADDDRPRGRLALTDDDRPRGRLALTNDDNLRRGQRAREAAQERRREEVTGFRAHARSKAATRPGINPVSLRDIRLVREFEEIEETEQRQLEAAQERRREEVTGFRANTRSKAATRPGINPVSLRDIRLVREYAEQEEAEGAGKRSRGKRKPKPKTKEVLNIPKPILEYFDVKNDPHFIRAHHPTAPK